MIGWALTGPDGPAWHRILGLAHDRKQARLPYEAVMADLAPLARRYGRSALAVTRYLGIRSDLYGRHREYHTASREARDAVRGESTDLGIFDEVRTQRDYATFAALEPTTTARPDPLILAISTAGDDRSVLLRDWWERGLRVIDGEPGHGFGMTWYAAPDDLDPSDPRAWRAANPAVAEGRIPIERILEAYHGTPPSVFRAERLNLWTDALEAWLPPGTWTRQNGPQPTQRARVVFGVEAVPSWRHASILVALVHDDGCYLGIAGALDATTSGSSSVAPSDLVAELERLRALWHPTAVAYSTAAAAAPHVVAWAEGADVKAVGLSGRGIRQASELFRSELVGGRLTHADDPLLALQARTVRPSGPLDAGEWYLSVRESPGEVDAIRAAAWAAWAAIAPEDDELPPQVFV